MADPTFNILSLCSGAGMLDLGVHLACGNARTVGYVEIEAYACAVLDRRMEEGALDAAPLFTDLRAFDGRPWRGVVDCIIGGYPCQPFSCAGARRGTDDPRHLWPDIARIIREIEPGRCFFENVGGHLSLGFREVGAELQAMGYRVAAGLFSAVETGASHRRERLFIVADCGRGGQHRGEERDQRAQQSGRRASCGRDAVRCDQAVADPNGGHAGADGAVGDAGDRADGRLETTPGRGEIGRTAAERASGRVPLTAPGPNDPRWPAILEAAPELVPADSRYARWCREVRNAGYAPNGDPAQGVPARVDETDAERALRPAILQALAQSLLRRAADDAARRVDRLRLSGNGVYALAAARAWVALDALLAADRAAGSLAVSCAA